VSTKLRAALERTGWDGHEYETCWIFFSSSLEKAAHIQGVVEQRYSIQNCAIVITHLLRVIDAFASHTPPVSKSVYLLIACLKSHSSRIYVPVAGALKHEIRTILSLSFGDIAARISFSLDEEENGKQCN
jgi:hypothetical protein